MHVFDALHLNKWSILGYLKVIVKCKRFPWVSPFDFALQTSPCFLLQCTLMSVDKNLFHTTVTKIYVVKDSSNTRITQFYLMFLRFLITSWSFGKFNL